MYTTHRNWSRCGTVARKVLSLLEEKEKQLEWLKRILQLLEQKNLSENNKFPQSELEYILITSYNNGIYNWRYTKEKTKQQ